MTDHEMLRWAFDRIPSPQWDGHFWYCPTCGKEATTLGNARHAGDCAWAEISNYLIGEHD